MPSAACRNPGIRVLAPGGHRARGGPSPDAASRRPAAVVASHRACMNQRRIVRTDGVFAGRPSCRARSSSITSRGGSPAENRRSASRRRPGHAYEPGCGRSGCGRMRRRWAVRRGLVPLRPDACRPPDRMQARDEVPTCPPPLKFVAPVRRAQPNRHAMGQMVLCPRSLARAPADCAHRELPDPLSLVEALHHGLIIAHTPVTPLAQTVPCAYQVPFASVSSDRAPSGQVALRRRAMWGW